MVAKRKYVLYIMDYSRKKNKAGRVGGWGWGGHTFLNPPFLWKVFYFALGNSRQNKASPLENPQNWGLFQKKNSRVFQIVVRGGGESEILLAGIFLRVKETWGRVILTIQTFFKAKNSFLCEYWTSVKIKIKMTCVQRVWN